MNPDPIAADLITIDDVRAAQERLEGVAVRTPMEASRAIERLAGVPVFLKCEHLQRTGSFKIRGAYNRISRLSDEERARGVVCSSAGNHAQGVALSARLTGAQATVFMPEGAPLPKLEATEAYGARVVLEGTSFDETAAAARAWAEEQGAVYVHPFEHPDVIAGQGTVGLEILDQVPDVATVLVPVGGGGLIAGIATAVKALRPEARVIGVQAAGAAPFPDSITAGAPKPVSTVATIADGIAVKTPGTLTLAHVTERVDQVVTVSDEAIARAVLVLVERAKQVVEPAGAATVAALLAGARQLPQPVVAILSGGNVDPLLLLKIIQTGLGEESRYFAFRTRLPDQPGALSKLLALLADQGANVLAVEHHRHGVTLSLLEVEVALEIETRGPAHIRQVAQALMDHGYPVA